MDVKFIKNEIIEDFITKSNLSKTAFSKLCGISPRTLDKILTNNVRNMTMRSLRKIAKFMNTPIIHLLNF